MESLTGIGKREQAKLLFWRGYTYPEINRKLEVALSTLHYWSKQDEWAEAENVRKLSESAGARFLQLTFKEEKSEADYRELDEITKQQERLARIRRYEDGGNEADLNPKIRNRNKGQKKRPSKHVIDDEGVGKLKDAFLDGNYGHQKIWWQQHELGRRIRNILKSRQIGATYYFAREAVIDALITGKNKIFVSASKRQAFVFRTYIIKFVREVLGIELRGDPIVLPSGAELHFLGTNSATAQSYNGDLYMDEYFWIRKFQEFRDVSSGMALQKMFTQTYFSTPSVISHEAYPFWTGSHFNRGRPRSQHIELDVSPAALRAGRLDPDGHWRQIVTIEDAIASGYDRIDIDQAKIDYNDDRFRNLLMCEFMDDTLSVFGFALLQACLVDSWVVWTDFKPLALRPMASMPVWIGYDPSRAGDGAAVLVVAPPTSEGGKYRIVEKLNWQGVPFPKQAEMIRKLTQKYNVQHLEVDCTGPGAQVVADLIEAFYPNVVRTQYSPQFKGQLIAKAMNILENGRLEFDAGWRDLVMAMLAIRKTVTPGGLITYQSGRSEEIGHADEAWALLHALNKSEITAGGGVGHQSIVEII